MGEDAVLNNEPSWPFGEVGRAQWVQPYGMSRWVKPSRPSNVGRVEWIELYEPSRVGPGRMDRVKWVEPWRTMQVGLAK